MQVADFGTARVAAPVGPTWCPLNTGTLGSMAPEMFKPVYADCADPDDGTYASYAPPQAKVRQRVGGVGWDGARQEVSTTVV